MRERTSLWVMLYGVYLYYCCGGLVRASRALEPYVKRSHVAVWKWVQRLAPIADRLDVDRRVVRCLLVDETMIRVGGLQAWVWVAFEPHLRCFLAFHLSWQQSSLAAYLFLKELRARYGRRPIYTDGAGWYPPACRWLRLEHHVYAGEWRSLMERMNQYLKDRTEAFDDLFPCFKEDCDLNHVHNWMSLYRFYHNHIRVNLDLGRAPLQTDSLLEHKRFIQLLQEAILS
jgi:putative transposase